MKRYFVLFIFILFSVKLNAQLTEGWDNIPVFDSQYYISTYFDVAQSGIIPVNHWKNYGISEGRQSSIVFNSKWYLENYPDLLSAFGSENYVAAVNHFLIHGMSEGRQASPQFDPIFYKSQYQDLRDAYGEDMAKYYLHYVKYGKNEGRICHRTDLNQKSNVLQKPFTGFLGAYKLLFRCNNNTTQELLFDFEIKENVSNEYTVKSSGVDGVDGGSNTINCTLTMIFDTKSSRLSGNIYMTKPDAPNFYRNDKFNIILLSDDTDWFNLVLGDSREAFCTAEGRIIKIDPCSNSTISHDYKVNITPISQPTYSTCWAACAAMMHSYHKGKQYSIESSLEEIETSSYEKKFLKKFRESIKVGYKDQNGGLSYIEGFHLFSNAPAKDEPSQFFIGEMGLQGHNGSIFELDIKNCLPILAARCFKQPESCEYKNISSHVIIITGIIGDGTPECTKFRVIDPYIWDNYGSKKWQTPQEELWSYYKLISCCQAYAYYPKISKTQYFENTPPKQIENIPISYQKTIKVKSSKIKIFPFDNEKEDGDIISINLNGDWILHQYTLENWKNSSGLNKVLEINLVNGENNYLISKAWNVGSIKPNTLTLKIDDGILIQEVVINSEIGLSGGILINLEK